MTDRELARQRLRNHHIEGPVYAAAENVVDWMGGPFRPRIFVFAVGHRDAHAKRV